MNGVVVAHMLPEGFAALEPFVEFWVAETANERANLRFAHGQDATVAFYAAAAPLLDPALVYLDARPIGVHDARDQRLMRLMLMLAHVSLAVEVQLDDEPVHAQLRAHMRITRAPADNEMGG